MDNRVDGRFFAALRMTCFAMTIDRDVSSLDLLPDQPFTIQVFGTDIQNAEGISVRLRFDDSQVAYERLDPGDAIETGSPT